MTNSGNDCYFFYYSTCSKGDSCPFRHCEAAMGSEMVCNLWQEGRCFRAVCKFRHMEITKNRKEIPCYWEKQPAGCQKPHCAFFHERPRFIEDVFVPPNKSVNKTEVQQHEEPEPPVPASLPTAANPQLRGVIKTDNQELVPSPTHPPVVINPADDDEDEDDQFSEEGEDGKGGPSPRKLPKSGESLNFGVSTLEEIRLRKALKASMKRTGYPIQSAEAPVNGEKENIQSFFRPTIPEARGVPSLVLEETGRPRGSVAERLGRKVPITDANRGEGLPLKRSLAERLGGVVDAERLSEHLQKTFKPVKERLGLFSGSAAHSQQDDPMEGSKKVPEQIRIKTLEEIKQEKASKAQGQNDAPLLTAPEKVVSKTSTVKSPKDTQVSVKTFSEILQAKRKRQEGDEEQRQSPSLKKTVRPAEKVPSKSQEALDAAGPPPKATNVEEVRVKTLEEIRREKAARMQVQHNTEAESKKSSDSEDNAAKRPRLLRIKKLTLQSNASTEKSAEGSVKPLLTAAAAPESGSIIQVKSLEEIKREKQLRKQELEEQDTGATESASPHNQSAAASLKMRRPVKISLPPSSSASGPDPTLPTHKRIPLKSKAASQRQSRSVPNTAAAAEAAEASVQPPDTEPQSRNTRSSSALPAAQCLAVETPAAGTPLSTHQKKSPQHTADTKVRPKLNVKPSVVKPAVQVKPGQKRRRAEQSAVAAVKPLNSASTVQEAACTDTPVLPSLSTEAQLSSAVPCSPTNQLDSGSTSSPLREELQTVPVFKQTTSPAVKTPTQPKSRRASVAAARTAPAPSAAPSAAPASSSAEDDFDDLINEFTDDHLEDDMDPAIGEDDLLQELSEMIDS